MNIVIIEDTREQKPLEITKFPVFRGGIQFQPGEPRPRSEDFKYPEKGLPVGDYSLKGFDTFKNPGITIERKADDLYQSLGTGRERFLREVEKMRAFRFRALVIETTRAQIEAGDYRSLITPASVLGTLDALAVRAGLHIFFCGDAYGAARQVESLVEKFARGIKKDWNILK